MSGESRPIILGARCRCGWFLGDVAAHVTLDSVGPYVERVTGTCKRHGADRPAEHDYHVYWTGEAGLDESYPALAGGHQP